MYELLDAVRYGGAPLDEVQRREFAVTYRDVIAALVVQGVLLAPLGRDRRRLGISGNNVDQTGWWRRLAAAASAGCRLS